tara:strand:- start:313 stop:486 length:174 start_codon:yes stop_codon:yes gene_type:complete
MSELQNSALKNLGAAFSTSKKMIPKKIKFVRKKEKTKNDNMNIEYSNLKLVKFAENH